MKIEVLGPGCAKCKRTYEAVAQFVKARGLPHEVVKVEAIEALIAKGVLATPAVVVDGKVALSGRVPSEKDLEKILG
jgi:small redox-active disulfide protein 2